MFYFFIAAGAAGIICGSRFKAAALVAFSVLIFLALIPISLLSNWSIAEAALMVFGLLAVFQAGYLAGLFWCIALPRVVELYRQLREVEDRSLLKDTVHLLASLFHGRHQPAKLAAMGGTVKPDEEATRQ